MSGQVRRAWEAIAEIHWTFRDTREDRHSCVPISVIAQQVKCPRGVSRLHAPEIYSKSSSCSGLERLRLTLIGTFEEGPVFIVASRDKVLRRKTMRLVRVLWRHCGVEESTWEYEDTMRATYPFLVRDEGTWFNRLRFKRLVYMHDRVRVAYACE